jgi:SAM-dependent methyltransferase
MKGSKSDWYSKTWYTGDKKPVYLITRKIILKWLNKENKGKLLDVGCGYGILTKLMRNKYDAKITAIDYDPESLEKAKKTLEGTDVKVEKQNILELDYEDNTFDVLMSTGYTSAATLPGAIKEVKRVVKPNGVIILDYLRFYNFYYFLSGNFFNRLKRYLGKEDEAQYYFGKFGLKKYFEEDNGLKIEDVKSFYSYPPFLKSNKQKLIFEKTFGKILEPFLARVLILKIRNIK